MIYKADHLKPTARYFLTRHGHRVAIYNKNGIMPSMTKAIKGPATVRRRKMATMRRTFFSIDPIFGAPEVSGEGEALTGLGLDFDFDFDFDSLVVTLFSSSDPEWFSLMLDIKSCSVSCIMR